MSNFSDSLHWRYATKKFDASKKLSKEQLDSLIDAAGLAASSYGLQPYKLLVITNPDLRAKIRAAAWNQAQVTDASHLLVFAAKTGVDDAYIGTYIANIAKTRGMPVEALNGYRDMMLGSLGKMNTAWCQRQAYIALGTLLAAAAHEQIDACPMEGFDPVKVDEILGLAKTGLTATAFCPVGFRAADDESATYKKVRLARQDFVIELS